MVTNGRIPVSQMVMRQGLYLWPSTASKFDLMDAWLVSLGYEHMVITQPYGAYRSIADQIKVKAIYGAGAATPGYSNHGLGTAWDIYNIDHYPDAIIAQGAAKFNLRRDAGNGAGGIESWHLHDYDQTVPADSGDTPITPTPPTVNTEQEDDMKIALYGAGCIAFDSLTKTYKYIVAPSVEFSLLVDNPRSRGVVFDTLDQASYVSLTNGWTRVS